MIAYGSDEDTSEEDLKILSKDLSKILKEI
jgi:hypothetical protein